MTDFSPSDGLDQDIERALADGWSLIPQVGHGTCDNALARFNRGITDVVTIPAFGHSTVVRLQGGPEAGRLRWTGRQCWRHLVPPRIAVEWVLTHPEDDRLLTEWELEQAPHDEA
jgi:hypothetical protein